MSKAERFDWVTADMFDGALKGIVDGMSAEQILDIPGVYECLSEELNNDVLAQLKEKREEEQGSVCPNRADGGPHEYDPDPPDDGRIFCKHCGEEE